MTERKRSVAELAAREALFGGSLIAELGGVLNRVCEYQRFLPAAAWVVNPLWAEANWSATSYQFDRDGDCPPVMGLAFENCGKGRELFRAWTEKNGNHDELEEIRITVIEGDMPGDRPGYFIHIGCDPENSMIRATAEGIVIDELPLAFLGQIQRMYPIPETPPMLPRFKELYQKDGEFLFAPVSARDDGKYWVDLHLGIVKREIHFRTIKDMDRCILEAASELRKGVPGDGSTC